MENNIEEREKRAQLKVKRLKGFYTHLIVYVLVNTFLIIIKIVGTMNYGEYFMGPFWDISTIAPPFLWGIGLAIHGFNVFGLGRGWEERQIKKYMAESSSLEEGEFK